MFAKKLSSEPQISIIIPCYAYAHYLPEALDSIMRSDTARPLEIIVVDDASPDDVLGVCKKYPGVQYLRHPERTGVSCARNTGIAQSRGAYVITLDADDALLYSAIEDWVEALNTSNASIAYGDGEFFQRQIGLFRLPQATWELLCKQPAIPSAAMQKREAWERIREANGYGYDPFQPLGWEDRLYYLEAYCLGMEAIHVGKVCFRYRWHEENRSIVANNNLPAIRAYQRDKINRFYGRNDVF